ncbi:Histone H3.2 [Cytospora mali]|uniref:Histone H3.2 n=1 Tax=Cytospora mali TaxID=578113 RepID=A0A194W7K7_CYTMA|nr:Histone H3.2 [Valsa mali]
MYRLLREIAKEYKPSMCMSEDALSTIHELVEDYIVRRFQAANLCCFNAKRITITPQDIKLLEKLIHTMGPST